jgi:hypothetical protein
LERTADVIGPDGDRRIADVSTNMRIVFRITPQGAEVLDLINKRIPLETRPARQTKKSRHPQNDPKV